MRRGSSSAPKLTVLLCRHRDGERVETGDRHRESGLLGGRVHDRGDEVADGAVFVRDDEGVAHVDRAVRVRDVDAVRGRVLDLRRLRRNERAAGRAEKNEGADGGRRNKARFHGSS